MYNYHRQFEAYFREQRSGAERCRIRKTLNQKAISNRVTKMNELLGRIGYAANELA